MDSLIKMYSAREVGGTLSQTRQNQFNRVKALKASVPKIQQPIIQLVYLQTELNKILEEIEKEKSVTTSEYSYRMFFSSPRESVMYQYIQTCMANLTTIMGRNWLDKLKGYTTYAPDHSLSKALSPFLKSEEPIETVEMDVEAARLE